MTSFVDAQAAEWTRYKERYSGHESVSGPGSTLSFTVPLRAWLPTVFERYDIISMLDAPCGDFHWMNHVDLGGIRYMGWDIESDVIRLNQDRFSGRGSAFRVVNLLTVPFIPAVDLILCRDFLIHIPDDQVINVLGKFIESGSRYLLTTNFRDCANDVADPHDSEGFYYRPVNLEAPPFNLTNRLDQVAEPGREPGREQVLFAL